MINLSILLQTNAAQRIQDAVMPYLIAVFVITLLTVGGRILLDFLLKRSGPPSRG